MSRGGTEKMLMMELQGWKSRGLEMTDVSSGEDIKVDQETSHFTVHMADKQLLRKQHCWLKDSWPNKTSLMSLMKKYSRSSQVPTFVLFLSIAVPLVRRQLIGRSSPTGERSRLRPSTAASSAGGGAKGERWPQRRPQAATTRSGHSAQTEVEPSGGP